MILYSKAKYTTTKNNREMTEIINYLKIDNDRYVGYCVNHPGVSAQAKDVEELKTKMKTALKSWLEVHLDMLDAEEPFELKGFDNLDAWVKSH